MVWSKNVSILKGIPGAVDEGAYLSIQCSQDLSGAAEVFETEDVDDACVNATTFNMTGQNNVAADTEKWFELNLSSVCSQDDKVLVLKYTNNGGSTVNVQRGLSPECPTTGVQERAMVVAPGATFRDTIVRAVLDLLPDFSYLGITADGAIYVEAEEVTKRTSDLVNPISLGDPQLIHVDDDAKYIKGKHVYMVPAKELLRKRHQPRLTFDNTDGSVAINATVDIGVGFKGEEVNWSACYGRGLFECLAFGYPKGGFGNRTSKIVNLYAVELRYIDFDENIEREHILTAEHGLYHFVLQATERQECFREEVTATAGRIEERESS